jgi:hypothetical protein
MEVAILLLVVSISFDAACMMAVMLLSVQTFGVEIRGSEEA